MKALDKQLGEAKKCILVCANCHRGIHAGYVEIPNNYQSFYDEEIAYDLLHKTKEVKENKLHYCQDCGKIISSDALRCPECASKAQRVVDRPNREELKKLIREKPFTQIGTMFGVSDNAIRKWCIAENLPTKKTLINNYSNEEWKKI